MEELTIEQKAKVYDEAIERARELSKTITGANYEYIFPELKESDDERTRREIITYLSTVEDKELIPYESWLAWLKKQGADKPYYTDLLGYFEIGKRLNHSVEEIRNWLKSKI